MTDLEWLEALDAADRRASVWSAAQVARSVLHLVRENQRDWLTDAIEQTELWAFSQGPGWVDDGTVVEGGAEWACLWACSLQVRPWGLMSQDLGRDQVVPGKGDSAARGAKYAAALVRPLRWPLTAPTLHTAPEAVQVAWDLVCADRADHTMADLVEAHARAQRLGLDWADSAQRAVAERARDEDAVRAILTGRAA